jgi:hypothetical protein
VRAFDRDRVKLFVLDPNIKAFVDLVAPPPVLGIDRFPALFVNQLLAKTVPGFLIDLPEGDTLGRGRRIVKRDRTLREKA